MVNSEIEIDDKMFPISTRIAAFNWRVIILKKYVTRITVKLLQTYISNFKVLSHEEIKRSTGLGSNTTES